MDILIRNEQVKDYRRVEEITRAAFSYPERIKRGGIGCPYEHWMVHELRRRDGIPELSLVAEVEDTGMPGAEDGSRKRLVGHVICSKGEVRTADGAIPVLNFGPLSVLPEYQKKGIGKALIKSMIGRAAELGLFVFRDGAPKSAPSRPSPRFRQSRKTRTASWQPRFPAHRTASSILLCHRVPSR